MGGEPNMDELKLYYFCCVCRHLSFTRAAQACNVVQSTISKQIASLEEELGVKLFHRKHRSISLTPAGMRLLEHANTYTNQYRAINASVQKLMMDYSGRIKIGVGQYEADLILEPLKHFAHKYPEVEVNCMLYPYSNLVSLCGSGALDVAIGTELCSKMLKGKTSVDLLADRWLVAAHRDSDFWKLDPERQRRLDGQLVITTYNNDYEPVRPHCISHRTDHRAFTYSNTYASQLLLLRANMGIALLPSYLRPFVPECVRMEDLMDPPLIIRFTAIYDPEMCTASTLEFLHICRESLATLNAPNDHSRACDAVHVTESKDIAGLSHTAETTMPAPHPPSSS
jgi:DNA-binding transcriptional LysR family regulator